ncbi:MAG: hypothetical protein AAF725_05880 [Acidobacteriota bacterium]
MIAANRGSTPAPRPGSAGSALLVVATLGVFFAQLEIRSPNYFLWDDNASEFLPGFVYTYESLAERGEIAQLNYHQYLGYTFLASGQMGVLYPPIYLAMAFAEIALGDFRHGLDALAIGHFLLAGLGMLAVCRRVAGASSAVPIALAVLWATSPFFVQLGRSWIHVAFTSAWLPWSFLLLLRVLEKPTHGRVLALSAAKALFFFQGHPHFFLLVAAGEGLYVLCRWLGRRRPSEALAEARALALGALGSLCLAAPLLFPMWRALEASAARSRALPFEEFIANALDPGVFASAQIFAMEPAVHWATGSLFYIGLPHVLALAAGRFWRPGRGREALPVALLLFASSTALWGLAYGLPVVSSLRWPFKAFGVAVFYLFLLLAGAYGALASSPNPWVRRAAVALLATSLASHAWLIGHPSWDRPLGPNRIDRDVEEIRREVAAVVPEGGRAVSLWLSPLEPRLDRFLIFQYATLAGAYHLGGYEPMIARTNFELAKRLEYSNIYRYELNRRSLDDLSARSVRFLIAPTRPEFQEIFGRFPQLRLAHRDAQLEVWENGGALPFAFFRRAPSRALKTRFGPGGVSVEAGGGAGGSLILTVAPLEVGYRWFADGVAMGPPPSDGERLLLEVPPGTERVEVRYVDVPLQLGCGLAAAFALSAAGIALSRRLRAGGLRAPRGDES